MVLENFGLLVLDQLVQVEAESRIHEAPQVVPELGLFFGKAIVVVKDFTASKFDFAHV